jgi:hypothetical protein
LATLEGSCGLGDVGKDEEEEEERKMGGGSGRREVPFLGMAILSATLPHQWISEHGLLMFEGIAWVNSEQ